jgi:aarF domain-containing kinase
MSGKRLLDLAALFNATRGVAQKHIILRTRQVEVYNKTSSLARAVRNQTDRVTETAKAASILASRLNESAPAWALEAQEDEAGGQPPKTSPIPSRESTEANGGGLALKGGLEQDHFYERSATNSTVDERPRGDLDIKQETANRYPFPDGTIPPSETNLNTPEVNQEAIKTIPSDETPKQPLEDGGLRPLSSGQSFIPIPSSRPLSADGARTIQRQSELQIPAQSADALGESNADPLDEGHDEDSFYRRPGHISPALSSLPRVKIPKHPSNTQGGDIHLPTGTINSDSYYNAREAQLSENTPSVAAVPEQEQVPEGVNINLFYNPRIAKMLGGRPQGAKTNNLELKGAVGTPVEQTGLAGDKDQDTFNVGSSLQREPTPPEATVNPNPGSPVPVVNEDQDISSLAQEISKETSQEPVKVGHPP